MVIAEKGQEGKLANCLVVLGLLKVQPNIDFNVGLLGTWGLLIWQGFGKSLYKENIKVDPLRGLR